MNRKSHLAAEIFGKVQGVFFRASTKEQADNLGVTGYVRNRADGSVYLEAEGSKRQLKKLLAWCQKGPPAAQVERVKYQFDQPSNAYQEFKIRY